jgi:hypothetical protein
MTPDQFRRIALGFPGASEHSHMNHPDFRAGGRIFATLGYPDEDWGMVNLPPEQQNNFVQAAPAVFVPAAGVWGVRGATCVRLKGARQPMLRRAMRIAYEVASVKKAAKRGRSMRARRA